jgi:flagellar basal body-associated protein FliL
MPTQKQRQKDRQLIVVIVIVLAVAGAILFLRSQETPTGGAGLTGSQAARASVQRIRQQVSIPQVFFTDKILEAFTPYDPAKAPQEHGRENPFAPL